MVISAEELLGLMVERDASDLHIGTERPPYLRIDGSLRPTELPILTEEDVLRIGRDLLTAKREHVLEEKDEYDFSYEFKKSEGRFRINFFRQKGTPAFAIRFVKPEVPSFDDLNLPPAVGNLWKLQRGIVIVTGTTGSGKSTTLAAVLSKINQERSDHILTLEDPIEYSLVDRKSIVNQREIGLDTADFGVALKVAMREDPDVMLIGEMRDQETISAALKAGITGHLVFSTLHTLNVIQTINRVIEYFPADFQTQIRIMLGNTLQSVVSQRLLPRIGGGRVPAIEILICNSRVSEKIAEEPELSVLATIMEEDELDGMQTFDQHLLKLYSEEAIAYETALTAASSPHDFKILLQKTSGVRKPKKAYTGGF
ncbi:PilT/PilU family type 4a pilus ATPase [bacterium]|nr:PilT/PilU family type 4a pilus ATPase [bacterium]